MAKHIQSLSPGVSLASSHVIPVIQIITILALYVNLVGAMAGSQSVACAIAQIRKMKTN